MLTTAKPILKTLRTGLAVGALAVALSACGSTKWGFPYKADVQQGNWITAEQVARLEKGMTREQVRFILGTPTLQDIFRTNRWDYTYYNKPGYGQAEERHFTVWFDGDRLDHWDGDAMPNRQPFEKGDDGHLDTANKAAKTDGDKPVAEPTQDSGDAAKTDGTQPPVTLNADTTPAAQVPGQSQPEPLR